MINKLQALETMIDMVTDAAADVDDLEAIMELLYSKAEALDAKIIEVEEKSL
ncbi:MAG: hypothetical protein ACLRQZ_02925 [Clostridia bacterium]